MRMHSSRERLCGNNAVQFQSCDGSSYCTALADIGNTDIVSRKLRDSCGCQIFEIVKHRFCKTIFSTLFIRSGVTRDGRPLRFSSCTLVRPSVNCPQRRLTILALIMSGPYMWHTWRQISWRLLTRVQKYDNRTNLAVGGRQYQCSHILLALCNNYCRHRLKLHCIIPTCNPLYCYACVFPSDQPYHLWARLEHYFLVEPY